VLIEDMGYLEALRQDIRRLTRYQKLYRLLKEELTAKGYWKNKARGKPRDLRGG
jgi:hypothetical protein